MPKKPRESRTNIAALFGVLKNFKPDLNEKKEWNGKFLVNESTAPLDVDLSRDGILHLIGQASMELIDFMQNHDQLMNDYEGALGAIKRMHEIVSALMDMKEEQVDLIVSMETVAGRYKQLIDLVHHLAHDIPSEKCKTVVQNFLAFKGANLQPLVNYNAQETQGDAGKPNLTVRIAPVSGCCEACGFSKHEGDCPAFHPPSEAGAGSDALDHAASIPTPER